MKKLETIMKNAETITTEELAKIVNCENVDCDTLTAKQKLAVLVFDEMQKALTNKKQTLLLDCNFANSKFHASEQYKVDYFCLVSNDDVNTRLMQFYFSATKDNVFFHICTSCKKVTREQFAQLEDSLQFKVLYNKKTQQAKTSERKRVSYEEVVKVVKDVLAVLSNDAK